MHEDLNVIRSLHQLFSFFSITSLFDCTLGLGIKHGQSERTKDCKEAHRHELDISAGPNFVEGDLEKYDKEVVDHIGAECVLSEFSKYKIRPAAVCSKEYEESEAEEHAHKGFVDRPDIPDNGHDFHENRELAHIDDERHGKSRNKRQETGSFREGSEITFAVRDDAKGEKKCVLRKVSRLDADYTENIDPFINRVIDADDQ